MAWWFTLLAALTEVLVFAGHTWFTDSITVLSAYTVDCERRFSFEFQMGAVNSCGIGIRSLLLLVECRNSGQTELSFYQGDQDYEALPQRGRPFTIFNI